MASLWFNRVRASPPDKRKPFRGSGAHDLASCDSLGTGGFGDLAPLKYRGTPEQALARLEATLKTFAEAQIVHREALALQIIFTTSLGFRDQVDFRFDPTAESIDFRSRSLLGLFDFGKNRSRMQEFSLRFLDPA